MTVQKHPRQTVPFMDLGADLTPLAAPIEEAIKRVIANTDFILGEDVTRFEDSFAAYCDTRYGIGVDSGTSALEMALRALDVGPGDEVITAANTFIATVLAISNVGATPVLVDVDEETANIDPVQVEQAISWRTKAIIPVHLYGHPADMDPILGLARDHGIGVVEDASQAHGARYKGARVGSLGDVAAFSLYPAKNLGAFGDAGVLVTNDPELAERLRLLRNYGSVEKYHHLTKGHNRRLDSLHAAVLQVKLGHLDDWNEARRRLAERYDEAIEDLDAPVDPLGRAEWAEPVYHLYVVRSPERDALREHLAEEGISTGIHYPVPVHLQPAYAELGHGPGSFPVTERQAREVLSLPMYPSMSEESVDVVVGAITRFPVEAVRRLAS